MDWDKLRIFHAAAEAGSFTHAGENLNMSQSAVSRQVSALEQDLGVALFHRHARGLILTEQGEHLYQAAGDILRKLETVRSTLAESSEKPSGILRVTTTVALGSTWLTTRIHEFLDIYPSVKLYLILNDGELDLAMREADVAIRLRQPVQPELIQRRLFTVHYHLFASPEYIAKHGQPASLDELDAHRLVTFGFPVPPGHPQRQLAGDGRPAAGQPARAGGAHQQHLRHQGGGRARRRRRDTARLHDRGRLETGPAAAGRRGADLRHLLHLSGRAQELGPRSRLPRLPSVEGAKLALLISTLACCCRYISGCGIFLDQLILSGTSPRSS